MVERPRSEASGKSHLDLHRTELLTLACMLEPPGEEEAG